MDFNQSLSFAKNYAKMYKKNRLFIEILLENPLIWLNPHEKTGKLLRAEQVA